MQNKFNKASFIIFLLTILLTPLAFTLASYNPLDIIKGAIITLGILSSAILYLLSCFKDKTFYISKHPLFITGVALVASLIVSSLLSTNVYKSFFGQVFEIGSSSFLIILFLASLLSVYLVHGKRQRIAYIYAAIAIPFILIAVLHLSRFIFGADFMTLGILQFSTSTLLGKWNDVAIYSAIIGLLSYLILQFVTLNKIPKLLLIILSIISGFFIFVINSPVVWGTLAITMLVVVLHQYSQSKKTIGTLPIWGIVIIVLSIVCYYKGNSLAAPLINSLRLDQSEVVLPWQFTIDVAAQTMKESPLLGAGPNRFGAEYLKFKPQSINPTQFWNTEFNHGFALIPSSLVTQGIVGFALWIIFIISFAYTGFKALRRGNSMSIAGPFFGSLFLWLIALVYIPSHSVLLITFVLTGIFISNLVADNHFSLKRVDTTHWRFGKFVQIMILIIVIILAAWLIVYLRKTIALAYFQSGISSLNVSGNQDTEKAMNKFKKSLTLDRSDIYYQALSETNILKINSIAQSNIADKEKAEQVTALIQGSVDYTKKAIEFDPTNYYNYLSEARISEVANSLQIPNAFEGAKQAYINSLKYNPYNPAIYLSIARIEASKNNYAEAQKYIGAALQLKQNYTDAIFLLSQIQVAQGQIGEAITSVKYATQINPTNPAVFFQLGLLHYNNKDYQSAIEVLTQAVKLNNDYANAKYFLGLSYARLGKIDDAIINFESIALTNPENQEVIAILDNLRQGKTPFADVKPPVDSRPEKRSTLPVKEKR